MPNADVVAVHRTTNITLATALITFDGFSLVQAVALPPNEGHIDPLCEFIIAAADPKKLEELLREHESSSGGLMVPSRTMDDCKKTIARAMKMAKANYSEGA